MIRLLPGLFLLFLLTGMAPGLRAQAIALDPVDRIVAVVDEDVILRSELDRAVGNIVANFARNPEQLPPRDVLERQVLERLILMRLQLQRAEATGIRVGDAEVDQAIGRLAQQNNVPVAEIRQQVESEGMSYEYFRTSLREEIAAQRLRQRVVQSRVQVSDTEVDILLASDSMKRGRVHVAHILVAIPDGAGAEAIEAARTKIDGIRALIERGEMDFTAAAVRYSDSPNALDGGDLGWRNFDEIPPAFGDLLQGMNPGDVSQPLRGPSGFQLIKLVDKQNDQRRTATEYHVRGILIRPGELLSDADARSKLEGVREQLVGGADFAQLAREHSDDAYSRAQGGDMGWFQPYEWGTAVGDIVTALADGEISQPFRSEAGWHLIQRLEAREQDVTDELQRRQARETIGRRKSEEEYDRFLRQMRAEAFVETRLSS